MKIAAWVPIKMNNERLPGKNTLPLAGKPLCQYVTGELLKINGIDEVYVFCSEEEISDYLQENVIRIPRDKSLNSFQTKINDVILSFTRAVEADIYVYAQVTSPFLKKETIERGLNAVLSGEYDSALSVKKLRDFLWKDSKPFNYDPANIARTQDLEPLYQETGGFYIYTKELIEKYNRRTGFRPYFAEVSETEAVDIDYPEDYELAQSIARKDYCRPNDAYNIGLFAKWAMFGEEGGSIRPFFEAFGYRTCAIYGAGIIGAKLFDVLTKNDINVPYFIDSRVSECRGVRCVKPEEVSAAEDVEIIVVTPGFDYDRIMTYLKDCKARVIVIDDVIKEAGKEIFQYQRFSFTRDIKLEMKRALKREYNRLYDDYAVSEYNWDTTFEEFWTACVLSKDFMTPEELRERTLKMYNALLRKSVSLPLLDLVITTRCSLKCKKCFHLIPSYTKNGNSPFDVELETIKKDLDKLLSSVDFIFKINILGGEPFLYRNLNELLEYMDGYKNVGYFNIVTNSTIIPEDNICELLRNRKFHVFINDYGTPGGQAEEIVKKLKRFGIIYYRMKEGVWYDFGDLQRQNLTQEELRTHYRECSYNKCKSLMQGELHTCGFHKHGQRNGLLPDTGDSLRLHEYSNSDLKEKIVEFYRTDYFQACDYCYAPTRLKSAAIPAGEQE